jgi:serine/threonine protein kinase
LAELTPGGCALAVREKATSLAIGAKFGAYEVVAHHGAGGMADIWVARRIAAAPSSRPGAASHGARFAIKTLLKRRAHHPEFVERFALEADLHGRLDHPNIVRLLENGVEAGHRFMVLELIEGLNLRQMIHTAKPRQLPRTVVYDVMIGVCDALHCLHEFVGQEGPLGLVHCDVSPENVMVGLDGRVKLIDFGVATSTLSPGPFGPCAAVLETSVLRPGRHVLPGRLQYLAPERVDGRGLDRRSDIYSVGAMLFELIHGVRPFHADVAYELLTRICAGATVPGDPELDPEVRRIIERAMAVAPEDRIGTAQELADGLRSLRERIAPDGQNVGACVRRLFGLEEPDETDDIDLLWSDEKVTAELECLDSPCDTPLLEEGTALDVHVRELLRLTSSLPGKGSVGAVGNSVSAPFIEERAPRSSSLPDVFAPVARPELPTVDLFGAYGKRPRTSPSGTFLAQSEAPPSSVAPSPPSGTFLAPRLDGAFVADVGRVKPARIAAAHFEAGWTLLREGKEAETLAEWEAAMQLDPSNRSYAVNVQKLRLKLQR